MSDPTRRELERYVRLLGAGFEALRWLDDHAEKHAGIPGLTPGVEVCAGCMRYAVSVALLCRRPQDVIGERCPEGRDNQRRVWAVYAALDELQRGHRE